jgi:hypothetical protein
VGRPDRRNDLLSERSALTSGLELLLLVLRDELVHDSTGKTDAGDDGGNDESETPVADDGNDETYERKKSQDESGGTRSGDESRAQGRVKTKKRKTKKKREFDEPAKKMAMNWTEMATLSEIPSWMRWVSVSIRVVTSPGPMLSKKPTF